VIALKDILYKVAIDAVVGDTQVKINSIQFDSRKASQDDVFVAIRGTLADGHNFITKAVDQGVVAIICEEKPEILVNGITYVMVKDAQSALAIMASNYYGNW